MVGNSLGPYRILEPLGAGGMGEVYLAEDTRLGRKVAVKVLPSQFASDPERLARFEQEARAAAALNHPHIAAVFDVGVAEGTNYMVQEYLQGHTLRTTIDQGPLGLRKALAIGMEIAAALRVAHKAGIVHRDLKPENIFVTEEGPTKVLDFGLAKLTEGSAAPQSGVSMSPTMLGTQAGAIMGTAGYMAPEQVQGGNVDGRADVFALGCVLYELTTGRQPFGGKNVYDTISKLVSEEPEPVDRVITGLPAELQRLIRKCLAKDPEDRAQSAGDVLVDLRMLAADLEAGTLSPDVAPAPAAAGSPAPSGVSWRLALPAMLAMLAAGWLGAWLLAPVPSPAPLSRFQFELPSGAELPSAVGSDVAISRDGSKIVYVAAVGGRQRLYLRRVGQIGSSALEGTENARDPAISPDGEWAAFQAGGALKKVSLAGGEPFTLCSPCSSGRWDDDGNLVLSSDLGLLRVPDSGGEPELLIQPSYNGGSIAARRATPLPGGGAVLFEAGSARSSRGIYVVDLGTGRVVEISPDGSDPRWADSGHILFPRGGTLFAVPFDVGRLEMTGAPVPVVQNVRVESGGALQAAISATGTLVYAEANTTGETDLVWVDRQGVAQPAATEVLDYEAPRISPDGARVAVGVDRGGQTDIWILDLGAGTFRRLTTSGTARYPLWSPDGANVAFTEAVGVFSQPADGSGGPAMLLEPDNVSFMAAESWTPDGSALVFRQLVAGNNNDLLVTRPDGARDPVMTTDFDETAATLSHDGRWLAYMSNQSGASEVYVRPFPGPGGQTVVSIGGGNAPAWAPGDGALYYESRTHLVEVAVRTDPDFRILGREDLFELAPYDAPTITRRHYDVHPDGQRFLMIRDVRSTDSRPALTVVLNWFEELRQRVPSLR